MNLIKKPSSFEGFLQSNKADADWEKLKGVELPLIPE